MTVCPNKFFCFNQNTFILVVVAVVVLIVYYINKNNTKFNEIAMSLQNNRNFLDERINGLSYAQEHTMMIQHQQQDRSLIPPTRLPTNVVPNPNLPINIPTRGSPTGYQQVGVLVDKSGGDTPQMLPLYGQETYPGSRLWNYYTSSDGYHAVKLPVLNNNKDCQDQYGCEEIRDEGSVGVKGFNKEFNVNMYRVEGPRYNPFLY